MSLAVVRPGTKEIIDHRTTTRIALVLEYDGANYYGFQLQLTLPTIQGEIEKALRQLTRERIRISASSRTDTGVHALGQVISFRTGSSLSPQTFMNGLNYYLPDDIAVRSACKVTDEFDPRRMAVSREYNYYIYNSAVRSPIRASYAYRVSGKLDVEAMNRAAQTLTGTHDFVSFGCDIGDETKSTTRHIYKASVTKENDLIVINMVANAFLHHQVRSTVGTLIKVGLGRMGEQEMKNIIEARQMGLAGPTTPACGLCLMRVNYPNSFEGNG